MMSNPAIKFLFQHPAHFFAFGFGSGLSPKAPGTVGTLAAIPLWLLIATLSYKWQIAVIVISFFIGIYFCGKSADDLGAHDHGSIVWDEFVGYWLTMLFAPAGWLWILIGFALFRVFDILKPWPISWFDKQVSGGVGIMVDDVLAGLFAGAGVVLLARFL